MTLLRQKYKYPKNLNITTCSKEIEFTVQDVANLLGINTFDYDGCDMIENKEWMQFLVALNMASNRIIAGMCNVRFYPLQIIEVPSRLEV